MFYFKVYFHSGPVTYEFRSGTCRSVLTLALASAKGKTCKLSRDGILYTLNVANLGERLLSATSLIRYYIGTDLLHWYRLGNLNFYAYKATLSTEKIHTIKYLIDILCQ